MQRGGVDLAGQPRRGLAVACDVFCDEGAYTVEESRRLLAAAKGMGFDLRVHAEELARLGAAELAVEDQSVDVTDVRLAYAPAGADCAAAGGYTPMLKPGEEFSVCVTVTVRIPLMPEFIEANTATGQFVVERDRYVDG